MLSTMSDDRGRPCLGDLVADLSAQVHHVGRLDADSEGLLLLTNDGAAVPPADPPVASASPRPTWSRSRASSRGPRPAAARGRRARRRTGEGRRGQAGRRERAAQRARAEHPRGTQPRRPADVRRRSGYPVTRLARVAVGPIRLGDLKPGPPPALQPAEVQSLYRACRPIDLSISRLSDRDIVRSSSAIDGYRRRCLG